MVVCPGCGARNEADARICDWCGRPFVAEQRQITAPWLIPATIGAISLLAVVTIIAALLGARSATPRVTADLFGGSVTSAQGSVNVNARVDNLSNTAHATAYGDGRNGHDLTYADGTKDKGRAAGLYRCKPDGSGFERIFAGGMDNPVEVAFTPAGEPLVCRDASH